MYEVCTYVCKRKHLLFDTFLDAKPDVKTRSELRTLMQKLTCSQQQVYCVRTKQN